MEITTSSLTITYASLLSVIIIHIAVSTDIELSSMRSLEPRDFVKMFLKYLLTIRRFKIYFSNETRFKRNAICLRSHIFFRRFDDRDVTLFTRSGFALFSAFTNARKQRANANEDSSFMFSIYASAYRI